MDRLRTAQQLASGGERDDTVNILNSIAAASSKKTTSKPRIKASPCSDSNSAGKELTFREKLPSLTTLGLFAVGITVLSVAGYYAVRSFSNSAKNS